MSDSARPHRRQPTRLRHPWDSPGKNTGVGCHFLLQCMKVKCESEVAQPCPTLRDPMDCSPPGSSIHGIFQARMLKWGAIAFSVKLLKLILIAGIILGPATTPHQPAPAPNDPQPSQFCSQVSLSECWAIWSLMSIPLHYFHTQLTFAS